MECSSHVSAPAVVAQVVGAALVVSEVEAAGVAREQSSLPSGECWQTVSALCLPIQAKRLPTTSACKAIRHKHREPDERPVPDTFVHTPEQKC